MLNWIVQFLDRVGPLVFWSCAALLVAIDATVIALFLSTRSRSFVNRWAKPVIAANALLLGAGAGVPAVALVSKMAIRAFAPSVQRNATQLRAVEAQMRPLKNED